VLGDECAFGDKQGARDGCALGVVLGYERQLGDVAVEGTEAG
jgi:hypothetical protein